MSAALIGWIWKESIEKDLSTGARMTLFALSEHTNIGEHGDWRVFPGQERMAKMVGCQKNTLRKYMKELQDAGLLVVAHQFDDTGRQRQNLYWLQAPSIEGGQKLPTGRGQKLTTGGVNNLPQEGSKIDYKSLNKESLNKNIYREKPKKTKFTKPALDDVIAHFKEKGSTAIEAKAFFEYYETGDWVNSKGVKVTAWKRNAATWINNNYGSKPSNSKREQFYV